MSLDVQSSLANARRRLADLEQFQLPRLRSCNTSLSLHHELASEMRTDMEHVRRLIEVGLYHGLYLGQYLNHRPGTDFRPLGSSLKLMLDLKHISTV